MEKETKTILWKYVIALCVGLVLALVVCAIGGFFQDDAKENVRLLHDSFFSVGVLMVLFFGLMYVSGEGAFLGIGYALSWTIKTFIPFGRKTQESYKQYRERKLGKEKKKGNACVFFVGLLFIAISIVFLIIWYQM